MSVSQPDQEASSPLLTDENIELVAAKLQELRLRLLDSTRRNPLINIRFTPASTSFIRVVEKAAGHLALTTFPRGARCGWRPCPLSRTSFRMSRRTNSGMHSSSPGRRMRATSPTSRKSNPTGPRPKKS